MGDSSVAIPNGFQRGNDIFFMSDHKPGRFDMESRTLHFPLNDNSDVHFKAFGKRSRIAVSDDANFVFITGGALTSSGTGKMPDFQIYDIAADVLIDGPPVPAARGFLSNHAYAIEGNTLFVMGGDS